MIYTISFIDDYFRGGKIQINLDWQENNPDKFKETLLKKAVEIGRNKVQLIGFEGLVEQWDNKIWSINNFKSDWINNPPPIIWIKSN
jgi:hypothetical protein